MYCTLNIQLVFLIVFPPGLFSTACFCKIYPDDYDIINVILTFFKNLKELSITCGYWYIKFSLRSQPCYTIRKLFLEKCEVKNGHLGEIVNLFPNLEVLQDVVVNVSKYLFILGRPRPKNYGYSRSVYVADNLGTFATKMVPL